MLRNDGLVRIVNELKMQPQDNFIAALLDRIRSMNPKNLLDDDITVLLLRANGQGIPLMNTLLSPFRYLKSLFAT